VGGGGVYHLVFLRTAKISFENTKSVIMLFLSRVCFAEFGFERSEMMLCVEEIILAV
jgi:hypothetical protein